MCVTIDIPWDTSINTFAMLPQAMRMISQERVDRHSNQSATSSKCIEHAGKPAVVFQLCITVSAAGR